MAAIFSHGMAFGIGGLFVIAVLWISEWRSRR